MKNNAFLSLRVRWEAGIESALANAGEAAARQARQLVPLGDGRDGGHLRDCISVQTGFSNAQGYAQVTARNPHAAAVEMGTSRMRAQPYLRPALQAQAQPLLDRLRRLMRQEG